MTKAQAIQQFWSQFGVKAYDENTVPTGANAPQLPYITYSSKTDSIGAVLALTGSVWDRSSSWATVESLVDSIAEAVGKNGYYIAKVDGGYMWITKGTPFAQRMADPNDDMIRRVYINLQCEFLTAY